MHQKAKSFEDLIVWQKAHHFVLQVYTFTARFPQNELYGLTSQFRRAATSVAANIAEGFKKRGPKDKLRFLNIAQGSAAESAYYLILAKDLGYGHSRELEDLLRETQKLLESYSQAIRQAEHRNQQDITS